jgi:1-acyl-sn-glycerol-3-phosphate acyltransferase
LYFCRGRVFGVNRVPRTGGVLLLANHQSFMDPLLATLALPRECHYMARDTLFAHAWLKPIIEMYNAFPIKRDAADLRGMREALRRLTQGELVTAFPEGTRSHDGTIGALRAGVVLLARRARVPMVPCVILGAYRAWPRGAPFPRPTPTIVAYGEPLWPESFVGQSDDELIGEVRRRICALHAQYSTHPLLRA